MFSDVSASLNKNARHSPGLGIVPEGMTTSMFYHPGITDGFFHAPNRQPSFFRLPNE